MSSGKKNNGKLFRKKIAKNIMPVAELRKPFMAASFAKEWFADAISETRNQEDHHSRRREIVFAACFAETYIFEWTRDIVGLKNILDYFPPKKSPGKRARPHRNLKSNWKNLPKELFEEKLIPINPKLDLTELGQLTRYRNGLVHAHASRPMTHRQQEEDKPFPTIGELMNLSAGWAVNVVIKLIRDLHLALGTSPPEYIEKP